ncbi:MAG: NADH-quinone oxidoreductase subunit C [Gemmatimonadetes bacterium]|nr:NADH-quinone oxidoreductase subunit C [Gemmatimonadota bacterium]
MSQHALDRLTDELGGALLDSCSEHGDETACIEPGHLHRAARFLRDDPELEMNMLVDVTAVDRLGRDSRFDIVYHLHSLGRGHRIRLKVQASDSGEAEIRTLTDLWKSAEWLEREVYDMFGVRFEGHPDLRRLLLYPEFEGHPLRKDYPIDKEQPRLPDLAGYPEVDYDASEDAARLLKGMQRTLSPRLNGTAGRNGKVLHGAEAGLRSPVASGTDSRGRTRNLFLDMGPSHPAMHGTIRISVELAGERIVDSDVDIGYLHRGFEKMCENRSYAQSIIFTDRLNYVSPIINNVGWSLAVEKLLGIEVPERAAALRVLMSEISRIADHLTCVAAHSMETGAFTAFLYLIEAREELYKLLERVCGGRVTLAYSRVGGVAADLPDRFEFHLARALAKTREMMADVVKLLDGNRIFQDRMVGVGAISPKDAISYGITGPFLRSTGVSYDVRKAAPYSGYEKYEFEVPVGQNGDNFDRYLVRMEEIRQSMRIIEQAIAKQPEGPIQSEDPSVNRPPKSEVYTSIEGLMHHFKRTMSGHGTAPPTSEAYGYVEGGNGELGFYLVSDGSDTAYRAHCRAPCFAPMSALSSLIEGLTIADVIPTFGTVNMIGGELDR